MVHFYFNVVRTDIKYSFSGHNESERKAISSKKGNNSVEPKYVCVVWLVGKMKLYVILTRCHAMTS